MINTKIHGLINWSWSLEDINSFINAFDSPYIGASAYLEGECVHLKGASLDYNDGKFHPFQAGIVYKKSDDTIFVATRNGTLIIDEIFSENGNNITDQVKLGDRFHTPSKYLEEALSNRVIYTPHGKKIDKNY